MSYYRFSCILALGLSMTGCAITSGLQTYDLPAEGAYQTDQGAQLNVVPLTQNNLPAISQSNNQNYSDLQSPFQ